jgi:hypothetical protein
MKKFVLIAASALVLIGASATAQTQGGGSVSVPGEAEDIVIAPNQKRAESPDGDPRSVAEMREHRQAFDKCTVNAPEPDMFRPVDSTPEERCSKMLGMRNRNAIPDSVKQPLDGNRD